MLFKGLHIDFSKVSDCREGNINISMADALMSGFAMFSLKDPSLLAFDKRRETDETLTLTETDPFVLTKIDPLYARLVMR